MGLKIVDEGYGRTPEMRKDAFWDDQWVPLYSEESAWEKKYKHHEGSLSHIKLVCFVSNLVTILDRSVSQVRMVPLHDGHPSSANMRRRMSSIKETIVPVKPEETSRRSSIAQFIRSASKLNLNTEGRKLSQIASTPHFRNHSAKEPSVRMFNGHGNDEAHVVTVPGSTPRFSTSVSGATLEPEGIASPTSGELSRVMSGENALQMFAIGDGDFRIGKH
ncbi:unnamed protein product [Strongylus vulgaris]|uniref:Uncharacterized protein n=1 Tax=Strongylus vulgaris TaxID=40348 RepID=A0A3P7JU44_STRVU|nr:unnamed protein product [Strongylus vulgaris]